MSKRFKYYLLIWVVLLVVFNVISFVVPSTSGDQNSFTGQFWLGYIFITIAFIGQLLCAHIAFKAENLKKLFYDLPLVTISCIGLIVMWLVGSVVMVVSAIPKWVGIIACILPLAFTAISLVKARWAAEEVERVDEKIALKTSTINTLLIEASGLAARAKSPAAKAACNSVYEAIRYSDPMSNEDLSSIEAKIKVKLGELAESITTDEEHEMETISEELVLLINERNRMCKAGK